MAGFLGRLKQRISKPALEPAMLTVLGLPLPVEFRRHAAARRLILRLAADGSQVIVTVPQRVSRAQALEFALRQEAWIAGRLARQGEAITVADGAALPLRGVTHRIRHVASLRGTVTVEALERTILVPGDASHLKRRLGDWLKRTAREELASSCARYADLMQVRPRRIAIRDQRSRWGSCSASGELSFSWRLILTPSYVLDYVAAHEVAHLRHMNHGPAFWRLVLTHCPDAQKAKRWLKAEGHTVHRILI